MDEGVERNRARGPSRITKYSISGGGGGGGGGGAICVRDITTFNPIGENKMQSTRDAGNADRY